MEPRTPRRDVAVCIALAALTIALRGPILRQGINLADEGFHLHVVERLAGGQVLYRDVECIYAPGAFYAFVPLVRAFGPDPVPARVGWLIVLAFVPLAGYGLARRFAPWPIALWAGLLPIALPPPLYKAYVPLCWIAGAAVGIALLRPAAVRFARAAAAGAAIGAIALLRQDVALYSLAVAAIAVLRRAPPGAARTSAALRAWLGLAAGAALVVAPVLAVFAADGALGPMLRQVFVVSARVGAAMANPAGLPAAARAAGPIGAALFAVPTVALGAGLLLVARPRWSGALRGPIAVPTALLAAAHVHWLQWPDAPHLAQLLPLATAILACAAARAVSVAERERPLARLGAAAWVLGSIAALAWGLAQSALPAWRERGRSVPIPHTDLGVRVAPGLARLLASLVSEVQGRARPGEPIFVAPYAPMLYLLAQRANPTRFEMVVQGQVDATVEREIAQRLDATGVRVVVVQDRPWIPGDDADRLLRFAPILARHLETQFRVAARIHQWIVYERVDPAADPNAARMRSSASSTFARELKAESRR